MLRFGELPSCASQHRELRTGEQRQSLAAASPPPIDPLDPDPCPAQRYQGVFADTSFSDSPTAARRPADDFFEPSENEREAGVRSHKILLSRSQQLGVLPFSRPSLDISTWTAVIALRTCLQGMSRSLRMTMHIKQQATFEAQNHLHELVGCAFN